MNDSQLHKRLNECQVKDILQKYMAGVIRAKDAMKYLGLGRTRFYEIVHCYRKNPEVFRLQYVRHVSSSRITPEVKRHIVDELTTEKKIIENPDIPMTRYNYSYIQQLLQEKYQEKVSVPTIIKIAQERGFYQKQRRKKKAHDRKVITNYVGELIQHDSSHHLFAPDSGKKYYLITSLDDYSRRILYGNLVEVETSWAHIRSLEYVCARYGIPYAYYSDQHRIFRYIKERDKRSIWYNYDTFTDEVDPQWKQVMRELGIEPKYALSPQAKGKIERPYQWLQDHMVRTCVREGIKTIDTAQEVLKEELYQYNNKRVHSTTGEIPMIRFNRAIKEGKTLFRPFEIPEPYESIKDIFSLRTTRRTNGYRTVSLKGIKIKVPKGECYVPVTLHLYPHVEDNTVEVRFWQEKKFLGTATVDADKLPTVRF